MAKRTSSSGGAGAHHPAVHASKQALAVIPARYGSTRFPGKPLAAKTGRPLIQHVIERVRQAKRVGRVIVATDDPRIYDAVAAVGGEAVMTRSDHPNGTSRIAEVVETLATRSPTAELPGELSGTLPQQMSGDLPEIVVNVQGDEPEVDPGVIDALIEGLEAHPEAPMATLASDFAADEDPADRNIVKLVVNQRGLALYFSRSLIPCDRDGTGAVRLLKHPGLYAYRRDFLAKYVTLPATPLEEAEKLEQLRALEHGYAIAVVKADVRHHGIDTPEQYEEFVKRWNQRQRTAGTGKRKR
ncbi:MAG: 3-deoxy-manno-octulosonate cytidylyltransferase [Phycisphaeraceae bacterium]|nr:3-deoxy-manno-octulosonate cytidylyltransferase [Phycisphaeraceae bacterium]